MCVWVTGLDQGFDLADAICRQIGYEQNLAAFDRGIEAGTDQRLSSSIYA